MIMQSRREARRCPKCGRYRRRNPMGGSDVTGAGGRPLYTCLTCLRRLAHRYVARQYETTYSETPR